MAYVADGDLLGRLLACIMLCMYMTCHEAHDALQPVCACICLTSKPTFLAKHTNVPTCSGLYLCKFIRSSALEMKHAPWVSLRSVARDRIMCKPGPVQELLV